MHSPSFLRFHGLRFPSDGFRRGFVVPGFFAPFTVVFGMVIATILGF